DVFTKAKRSVVMSRIRGAGNKDTELRLIPLMRAAKLVGWRRGVKLRIRTTGQRTRRRNLARNSALSLFSAVQTRPIMIRPDFVFPKQRVAVFVDGCFFHGCPRHQNWPKNNAAFWR